LLAWIDNEAETLGITRAAYIRDVLAIERRESERQR
jgi:hypothetical protein